MWRPCGERGRREEELARAPGAGAAAGRRRDRRRWRVRLLGRLRGRGGSQRRRRDRRLGRARTVRLRPSDGDRRREPGGSAGEALDAAGIDHQAFWISNQVLVRGWRRRCARRRSVRSGRERDPGPRAPTRSPSRPRASARRASTRSSGASPTSTPTTSGARSASAARASSSATSTPASTSTTPRSSPSTGATSAAAPSTTTTTGSIPSTSAARRRDAVRQQQPRHPHHGHDGRRRRRRQPDRRRPGRQVDRRQGLREQHAAPTPSLLAAGQWMLAPTDLNGANPRPTERPHIVNNSWGGDRRRRPLVPGHPRRVDRGRHLGIFSNGNAGPGCNTAGSPGRQPRGLRRRRLRHQQRDRQLLRPRARVRAA